MKNIKMNFIKFFVLTFIALTIFSCQKEDLNDLDKVIYVRHQGADMPAYIHGDASEKVFLIVLHGGPGGSGLSYRAGTFKSQIEKECAVVYFDQRGSGMAQGRYSEEGINVDIMVEDVVALTKVIQKKYGADSRFFLLGHSWGGTLGTATLLKGNQQDIFKGWIEVDGGHDLKALYFENIDFFKTTATAQIALGNSVEYWTEVLEKVNAVDTTKYDEEDASYMNQEAYAAEEKLLADSIINEIGVDAALAALKNGFLKDNPLTAWWNGINTNIILSDQGIWEELSYTNQLDKIKIPSLFLWGRYDLVIPPKMGQDAFDNIGSAEKEIVFFEKSGHSPMDLEADKFADEVIDFIKAFK